MRDHERKSRDPHEELNATSDYFWMLRSGVLTHTAGGWRSFRAGYAAIGREQHKKVVRAALELFRHDTRPGRGITKSVR